MKKIVLAAVATIFLTGTALADVLPLHGQRGAPIKVPTGVEVKGSTDYKLKPSGKVKQLVGKKKVNKDMLDATMKDSHDG